MSTFEDPLGPRPVSQAQLEDAVHDEIDAHATRLRSAWQDRHAAGGSRLDEFALCMP